MKHKITQQDGEYTVVYIAAPYRAKDNDGITRNIYQAIQYGKMAQREGYIPLVPHVNSLAIYGMRGNNTEVTRYDNTLLSKCDIMWVCTTSITKGMQAEIDFCHKHDILVVLRPHLL